MAELSMEKLNDSVIPEANKKLMDLTSTITKIGEGCHHQFSNTKQEETMTSTKGQIRDILSNVAYHVLTLAENLNTFFELQALEIEKREEEVKVLAQKFDQAKEFTSSGVLTEMTAARSFRVTPAKRELQDNELLSHCKPLTKTSSGRLNLKALDSVGTDLSGHRGESSWTSVRTVEEIGETNSRSSLAPPVRTSTYSPAIAAPPPMTAPVMTAPPPMTAPPVMTAPPPMTAPPVMTAPPPPVENEPTNAPPPPNPRPEDVPNDLPPAPSDFELPPPDFELPPPSDLPMPEDMDLPDDIPPPPPDN